MSISLKSVKSSCDLSSALIKRESSQSHLSLEEEYEDRVFGHHFDVKGDFKFKDFLIPNELNPEGIVRHLTLAYQEIKETINQRAIVVSTGGERSLFDLLFVDDTLCEGLTVLDINGRVKAYLDFVIMLLRICNNTNEFNHLSKEIDEDNEQEMSLRIVEIKEKINSAPLPENAKKYYLKYLEEFAQIYLPISGAWKSKEWAPFFKQVRYDQVEGLFARLKRYAIQGNIAVMIGDIGDIRHLKNRTIAAIDVSNIPDYVPIHFNSANNTPFRVIWTSLKPHENNGYLTKFHSYVHVVLTEVQRTNFDHSLKRLSHVINQTFEGDEIIFFHSLRRMWKKQKHGKFASSDFVNRANDPFPGYCVEMLKAVNQYIVNRCLEIPSIGLVDLYLKEGMKTLNQLNEEDLVTVCKDEDISDFLTLLIESWEILDAKTYLILTQNVDKWKPKFIKKSKRGEIDLIALMEKLEKANLFEDFVISIGGIA